MILCVITAEDVDNKYYVGSHLFLLYFPPKSMIRQIFGEETNCSSREHLKLLEVYMKTLKSSIYI